MGKCLICGIHIIENQQTRQKHLFWCHTYYQSVYLLGDPNLATQTAAGTHMKCLIEHIQLGICLFVKQMITLDIDLTGSA